MANREVLLDDLKVLLSQNVVGFDAVFARCTTVDAALICVGEQVSTYNLSQRSGKNTLDLHIHTSNVVLPFINVC